MAGTVEETFDMFDEEGTSIPPGPEVAEDAKKKNKSSRTMIDAVEISVSEPEKQVKPGK